MLITKPVRMTDSYVYLGIDVCKWRKNVTKSTKNSSLTLTTNKQIDKHINKLEDWGNKGLKRG